MPSTVQAMLRIKGKVDGSGRAPAPHFLMAALVRFAHDGHAAVGGLSDYVLELDGGVVDFELVSEAVVDGAQNGIAFGSRDVGNFHVG